MITSVPGSHLIKVRIMTNTVCSGLSLNLQVYRDRGTVCSNFCKDVPRGKHSTSDRFMVRRRGEVPVYQRTTEGGSMSGGQTNVRVWTGVEDRLRFS